MYSVKQKMKFLRELLNPEYAEADLRLLREVSPQNDLLRSPIINAFRSAEKILYSLLDQTTADRIRLNRRSIESEKQPDNVQQNENDKEKQPYAPSSRKPDAQEQPEGNTPERPREDNLDGDANKDNVVQQLEETQEELENTQSELEETQELLEGTQAELDAAKEELGAEKKSETTMIPDPKKLKKKTSTLKSTGKISSTKTSKSRR